MSAPETGVPLETGQVIDRFSRGSRWVHWLTAIFMTICILTAAVLYNGSLAVIFGHRYLVEQIHVYSGFALPVPLVVGILSRGLPRRRPPAQPVHLPRLGLAALTHPPRRQRSRSASSTPARSSTPRCPPARSACS